MPKIIYKYPKIVVAGLIEKNGKYLLVKEVLASGNETWIVPGGKLEFGETLEDALKRELGEELGIKVDKLKLLTHKEAIFLDFNYHTVIFFYLVESKTAKFRLEKGILEAKLFSPEELKKLKLVDSASWLFRHLKVL